MPTDRSAWLDGLRGLTIALVVLYHCRLALSIVLQQAGRDFHFLVYNLDAFLGMARMPAFFLCSGILFAGPAMRGWRWFLTARLNWTIWIAALWGLISIVLILSGFPLYLMIQSGNMSLVRLALIDPIGNMWFIYAIAVLGFFGMAVRHLNPVMVIAVALTCSSAALMLVQHVDFPKGLEQMVWNLGTRGFLFFAIGLVLTRQLRTPIRGGFGIFALGLITWAGCYYILKNVDHAQNVYRLVLSVPATFGAIAALQALLAWLPALSRLIVRIGRQSLEVFLLHQVFIGICVLALRDLAEQGVSGLLLLAIMFTATLTLSLAFGRLLHMIPRNPMFSNPIRIGHSPLVQRQVSG